MEVDGVVVTVLVVVLVLEVVDVDEGVWVTVAGGTKETVVVITVDVDVETDVLAALAGLITPQAMRRSESAVFWPAMSEPWSSTIEEPSGPLS